MSLLRKIGEVKPEKLAELAQKIKGFMSSAELAKALGVNPSTTSRILNGKVTGPVSEENIRKLADLITPDMGITRADLFAANGMEEFTESESYYSYKRESMYEREERMRNVGSIIVRSINYKADTGWRNTERMMLEVKNALRFRPDLIVECKFLEDSCRFNNHNWGFIYLADVTQYNFSMNGKRWSPEEEIRMVLPRIGMRFMERMAAFSIMYQQFDQDEYPYDYQYHEVPIKLSAVTTDRAVYDYIVEKYKNIAFPMMSSIILVDFFEGKVVAEMPFKNFSGYRSEALFDGSYFTDDGELVSEEEYNDYLEELIDQEMEKSKEDGE